jgi:hypothetical protein
MSALFTHIFIPVVLLLIFSKRIELDPRKIAGLSFFSILPDADAFLQPHRALLHNAFILVIPVMLFIFLKSRRDITGIICFYLASHLVLDLFNGGIFFLYPYYNSIFFARAELWLVQGNFKPVLDYGISDRIMGMGEPVISSENIGISILLMVLALLGLRSRRQ